MQDPSTAPFPEETLKVKRQKKASRQKNPSVQLQRASSMDFLPEQVTPTLKPRQKAKAKPSRRNLKNEVSIIQQQSERSNSGDSLPDSSLSSGQEYRALRRKYLMLEEEGCALGNELRVVEDEVRSLEDEKVALLDQLVVLEGLIDPSELHPHLGLMQ